MADRIPRAFAQDSGPRRGPAGRIHREDLRRARLRLEFRWAPRVVKRSRSGAGFPGHRRNSGGSSVDSHAVVFARPCRTGSAQVPNPPVRPRPFAIGRRLRPPPVQENPDAYLIEGYGAFLDAGSTSAGPRSGRWRECARPPRARRRRRRLAPRRQIPALRPSGLSRSGWRPLCPRLPRADDCGSPPRGVFRLFAGHAEVDIPIRPRVKAEVWRGRPSGSRPPRAGRRSSPRLRGQTAPCP
jgi:hypothetical protein